MIHARSWNSLSDVSFLGLAFIFSICTVAFASSGTFSFTVTLCSWVLISNSEHGKSSNSPPHVCSVLNSSWTLIHFDSLPQPIRWRPYWFCYGVVSSTISAEAQPVTLAAQKVLSASSKLITLHAAWMSLSRWPRLVLLAPPLSATLYIFTVRFWRCYSFQLNSYLLPWDCRRLPFGTQVLF